MRIVFTFALVLLLASCSGKSSNNQSADSTVSAEATATSAEEQQVVHEQVEAIYADVFAWYSKDTSSDAQPDFEARYMSSGYNEAFRKVEAIDSKESGTVGFFDSDHWVCGQDWQDLSMKVVDVTKKSEGVYSVEIEIHNLDTETHVTLAMVKENGQWLIDDMQREGSHDSEKSEMLHYIEENS